MKKILLATALLASTVTFGQQYPISSQYNNNRLILNPANVGDQNAPVLQLNYRKQWVGIQDAPSNQFLTFHSPIAKRVSVGAVLVNENLGIMQNLSANLVYGYMVDLAPDQRLHFGLAGGYYQSSIDFNRIVVQDVTEAGLFSGDQNNSTLNFDFGMRYTYGKFELGAASQRILNSGTGRVGKDNPSFNRFLPQFNVHTSYKYDVPNSKFQLEPMVLMRAVQNGGFFNDYLLNVNWNNLVWGNVGYRDGNNFIFSAGTWLTNNVNLMYSYNYSTELLSLESFGSHEIGLRILFKNTAKEGGPFTNNVRTGELSDEEKLILESKLREREERKKRKGQTIKIQTGNFDQNNPNSEINLQIKPSGTGGSSSNELKDLKSQVSDLDKKLNLLLKSDISTDSDRENLEKEILSLRLKMVELLESNDPENVHQVSGEIEVIKGKIEELRKKISQ